MKRKIVLLTAILFSCVMLISFEGANDPGAGGGGGGGNDGSPYEMNPPIPTSISIQKLPVPLDDGSNLKMMVQFTFPNANIPSTIDVYTGSDATTKVTFRDDGTGPDLVAGDGTYTAYLVENINLLISTLQSRVATINSRPVNLVFNGHDGSELTAPITININAFNAGNVTVIPTLLFTGLDCFDGIDKPRSLFITDTSIVEDPARTYNVVTSAGNPTGLYTFGNMFKQIANESVTGITPKQLMKSWVQNWTADVSVNGQIVAERKDVFAYLINPWLNAAGYSGTVDESNWSSVWDSANETALLEKAPFKLTAIVNRIDLRGNSSFDMVMKNTGETRFIFTLESPATGQPPSQQNQAFSGTFHDWKGMNVIFEYGNLPTNICDTRALAQQWLALSTMPLGSVGYKSALENITKAVINANAAPGKINGSAIDRIRTNERIFYRPGASDDAAWKASDWEFRQFELDATTHRFKQVDLTNTPVNSSNDAFSITNDNVGNLNGAPNIVAVGTDQNNLIDWAFSTPFNTKSIMRGNFIMPDMYGGAHLLAAAGKVDAEWAHYWDLNWTTTTANYPPSPAMSVAQYEQVRHEISLNTCQGCHAGETKTLFTQVVPLGYGENNQYWLSSGDGQLGDGTDGRILDGYAMGNSGSNSSPNVVFPNYQAPSGTPHLYPKLSAFLTGRMFQNNPASFYDDNNIDANDNNMDGLYYINSPSDAGGYFGGVVQVQYGYNDLQRRAQDMCALTGGSCGISVFNIGTSLVKSPFPLGSH